MRRADLEPGKAVESPFEDQMGQRDRRVERIAYRVLQPAVAPESLRELRRALWMDEDEHAEGFGLCPERMKLGVRKLVAGYASADRRAAQPKLFHAVLELLHGEIRVLQRHRGKSDEAVGMRSAPLGEFLVIDLDDLGRKVPLRLVPERVDAQRLDVYSGFIHFGNAPRANFAQSGPALVSKFPAHQGKRCFDHAMRMHVYGFYAPAVNDHLAAATADLRVRTRIGHAAMCKPYSISSRFSFLQSSAKRHFVSLSCP